jgi:4-hydroxybenzoate polyprenyltransferase
MKEILRKIQTFLGMIKFEHSVFALPFAYVGMMLASRALPSLKVFIAVTIAMVAARTFGMTVNRLIDKEIDGKNPRTKDRALPKGELSPKFVWSTIAASLLIFVISIYFLPVICWLLSPLALVAMWFYPYLKRFTWLSHLFLGLILAIAPVGGWLAVTGSFHWVPLVLAFGVACWVAGFDVLYALQDYHFDKEAKLFSIPVRWGKEKALKISRWLHFLTIFSFIAVLAFVQSDVWAWGGLVISSAIIIREHRILANCDLSKIEAAFFTSNAWVSVIFFVGIFLDYII